MIDAPEKIWIDQDDCPYFYEESELAEAGSPVTEYIRADLCHPPALEPSAPDIGKPITAPSAARELALEEVTLERSIEQWRNMKPSEVMKGSTAQITYALEDARKDILSLARSLSSPDHADAGKVEGDGWLPIESAPKDKMLLLACTDWAPVRELGREVPVKVGYQSFGRWTVFGASWTHTHWRSLPSAPASEGAE